MTIPSNIFFYTRVRDATVNMLTIYVNEAPQTGVFKND